MKYLHIPIIVVLSYSAGYIWARNYYYVPTQAPETPAKQASQITAYRHLLDAIEAVETGGESDPDNAVGDNGRAVGAYQLHHCYIEDVGRGWNGGDDFDDDDRLNKEKSRIMVRRYLSHYATYRRLNRYPTFEDMARIHNGGPNGWKKESTKKYWEKIKAVLYE